MLFGNIGNSTAPAGALDRGALLNVFYTALATAGLSFVAYVIGWLNGADLGSYAFATPILVAILRMIEQMLRDRSRPVE